MRAPYGRKEEKNKRKKEESFGSKRKGNKNHWGGKKVEFTRGGVRGKGD